MYIGKGGPFFFVVRGSLGAFRLCVGGLWQLIGKALLCRMLCIVFSSWSYSVCLRS